MPIEVDITAEVDRLFDPSSVPGDGCPVAVILWGGIATGKTALRKQKFATGYVLIDAADIFLSLSRGEYFDFPDGLEEPMDAIGRLVTRRALAERRSIVTEVVGAEAGPMQELLGALTSIGYKVEGVAVTCDLDESLRRNEARGDDDISSHYAGPYQQAWIVDVCRELAEARANTRVVWSTWTACSSTSSRGLIASPRRSAASTQAERTTSPASSRSWIPWPARSSPSPSSRAASTRTSSRPRRGRTRPRGRWL